MKQIGLILEGESAKIFLNMLLQDYHSSNFFTILTQDQSLIPQNHPNTFNFFCYDPTSQSKLQKVFSHNIDQFFIITPHNQEKQVIYQYLKKLFPNAPIVIDSNYSLSIQDALLHEVSIPTITANKLLTYLPNIPVILQDFGLNQGEIIEISVPPGSVYCYRQVGSITQKNWKIVGIYRNQELILSNHSLIIQPNDRLLAIGNPQMLGHIHNQITSSLGQFPVPFGRDIFLFIDERILSENEILKDIEDALFLHKKLNTKRLNIIFLNPKSTELLRHIQSLQDRNVHIFVEFLEKKLQVTVQNYAQKKIGLAILNQQLFHIPEVKKTLLKLEIPTCKTTDILISQCKQGLVFFGEEQVENIASVSLDIASQLNLNFQVYDFDVDGNFHLECLKSFQNISNIFGKSIQLTQNNTQNPIHYFSNLQTPTLNFSPFSQSAATSNVFKLASTDLSYFLANTTTHPQILIPIPPQDHK